MSPTETGAVTQRSLYSSIRQNRMDFVTEISFCKTPVVDEKMLIFSNRQGLKVR